MANKNDSDGVWRTISGRRVFIRNGQSISSAMKASGKFKSKKNESTKNKTKMQEMAVKGAPEKDLKDQYKTSLNDVSKMEYEGKINKDEYEKSVKNINDNYIKKRNEYNGTDRTNKSDDWKSEEGGVTRRETKDGTNYIQGVKKADGSTEYTRTDYDKKGNELSSKTYKSLDEAKAGGSKNESKDALKNNTNSKEQKIKELEKQFDAEQNIFKKGAIREEIDMMKEDFKGTKEEYRAKIAKEQERRLAEYQKEEKRKEREFKEKTGVNDYRMTHRPTETGITADNLLKRGNEVEMPRDMYDHPEYYSSGNKKWINETMDQLNKVRNNPDGEITIYRATSGDKINEGDWITLSKNYAQTHLESQLDNKGQILEMKVKAKDIQFAGDVLEEWGYFPKKTNTGNNGDWLRSAYNEYKKQHPNSKMSFNIFKKNNQ